MRGSPLLRALLAFLLIASSAYPLWRLTRPHVTAAPVVVAEASLTKITLRLTFSTPPASVAILHLGETLLARESPGRTIEEALQIEYPAEGVDLQFQVQWPSASNECALRVELSNRSGQRFDRTVWGSGEMLETLTFP